MSPALAVGKIDQGYRRLASRNDEAMMGSLDFRDPRAKLQHRRRAVKTVSVSVLGLPPIVRHVGLTLEHDRRAAIGGRRQRTKVSRRASEGMDEFRSPMHASIIAAHRSGRQPRTQ